MKANSFHRRVLTTILAVLGMAIFAVSTAGASSSPDAVDRFLQNGQPTVAAPDAIDRLLVPGDQQVTAPAPDAIHRALAQNDQPSTVSAPDAIDRALANRPPSPDLIDRLLVGIPEVAPDAPDATTASSPFSWADAGIGAAIAVGALLLTAAAAVAIRRQKRPAHL